MPSDLHTMSAIGHLTSALSSPFSEDIALDLHFNLAQAHISRVYIIADRVPFGESVSATLANTEGASIMQSVEKHLLAGLKFVTAASTQSTMDAYVFFFSCLKLAEYKMLFAAIKENAPYEEREALFCDAVMHVEKALGARPLYDNQDLNYCALVQLCQMLVAGRKKHCAVYTYSKLLMVLSVIVARSQFGPIQHNRQLGDEVDRQVGQLLCMDTNSLSRDINVQRLMAVVKVSADDDKADDDDEADDERFSLWWTGQREIAAVALVCDARSCEQLPPPIDASPHTMVRSCVTSLSWER